ncbi:EF-P lysine aminoacylase EpmA [Rhizobium sp. IBUN]|uniref:EF-P lysine aminoacylase EpmA n=1 Tax=Rhizobium sp. IBUN TaxID=1042326 RepID=UPI0004136F0A|nr:EF-P lysine aminoacylase EpmA [Rhizobium sp. IBUN]
MNPSNAKVSPWWTPSVHLDRRPFLIGRNAIQSALRRYFLSEDFLEVDTATLQVSPGNEAHLHAFATEALTTDGQTAAPLYLHTSPEFACKKLLSAGEQRIACFAHVYRNRERGPLHHPEFTMLEWYRVGESYESLMMDCVRILALAAETMKTARLTYKSRDCDPFAGPDRISVAAAFERYASIDLLGSVAADGATDRAHLADQVRRVGMRVADDDGWADLFSRVLVEKVEPHLGFDRVTILDEYPVSEAALARPSARDPRVAERFEVYACGVELANGFGELTNAAEQRRRFEIEMSEKARIYGESYPLDEDFLDALAIMPEASGIALGFDRLVMLATGASRIDQVMWAPVAEYGR